jgi:hypothetical protein
MQVCWAVQGEEAPGRGFSRSGWWSFPVLGGFACLSVWFGHMIPGLYEVIQYTLSLSLCVPHGFFRAYLVWLGVWYPVRTRSSVTSSFPLFGHAPRGGVFASSVYVPLKEAVDRNELGFLVLFSSSEDVAS